MRILFISFFLISFLFGVNPLYAEEISPTATLERRAQLEKELAEIETKMDLDREIIQEKQREATTLERDVTILNVQVEKARLGIRARNLRIDDLSEGIEGRLELIGYLLEKTEREKSSLGELLRKTNELDSTTLVEIILGYEKLSDFFVSLDSFESVHQAVQISIDEIMDTKDIAEEEKIELEDKKIEQGQLKIMQEMEKRRLTEAEDEKQKILKVTKGEEAKYQDILSAREEDATKIRNELFTLRDSAAIPFEKAVEYATFAWRHTGVRPAFVLGILAHESNMGEFVGQCLLKNAETGDGVGKNTGRFFETVMKPVRDTVPFLEIAKEVGFDPFNTPVSCPPSYGYGGAMGPAQFIPSTWVLFQNAIGKITGNKPPNPWDPKDAIVASSLLLRDNGAAAGGYTAERKAALRYFAGSNWSKPAYSFYGDDVMELATKYQKQIDILNRY